MSAPLTAQTSMEDALGHLAAESVVWCRLLAIRNQDGTAEVCLLEMVSGAPPATWEPRSWEYPSAVMTAFSESGPALADYLRQGQIRVDGQSISLPDLPPSVYWERHQSGHVAMYETLDWPSKDASLHPGLGPQYEPSGHLISNGTAPSFVDLYTAACAFFRMRKQVAGGSVNGAIVYRHQDRRARITAVKVANEAIAVTIEGMALDGILVELAADTAGSSKQIWEDPLQSIQTISFALENGLPAGAWILIRVGSDWIDRRFLAVPWTREGQAGVEYLVDATTRLEGLVAGRERDQVEFKRQVPKELDGKRRLMKTVCGFANGSGGSVLIGVDDDRQIFGLPQESIGRVSDQLIEMLGIWLEPRPRVEFVELPVEGGSNIVLEMWVNALMDDVCASGAPGETKTVYIRHHGVTERATVRELKALIAARTGSGATPWNAFS